MKQQARTSPCRQCGVSYPLEDDFNELAFHTWKKASQGGCLYPNTNPDFLDELCLVLDLVHQTFPEDEVIGVLKPNGDVLVILEPNRDQAV